MSDTMATVNDAYEFSCKRLGISRMRTHQAMAIGAVVERDHDLLLVSPTGSGKSIVFWLAGEYVPGVTLIVSPLKSLMADQERRLRELNLPVTVWNGDVTDADKAAIVTEIERGWTGYFYTTPESLRTDRLQAALRGRVGLAVVDEAHCCLADRTFRNAFANLGELLDGIAPRRRMACTATLVPEDRQKLIRSLNLDHPEQVVQRIARENFTFEKIARDQDDLYDIVEKHSGESGVIFVATVQAAMSIHETMESQGYPVTLYHGRLTPNERTAAQQAFMSGEKPIAIATDSFILGIDKKDIRYVVHYDIAASVEAWMQGAGRAGRDGDPAYIYPAFIMAYEGIRSREFLVRQSNPTVDECRMVWEFLKTAPWHRMSQPAIGMRVFGRDGKWLGPSIMTKLYRFDLCGNSPDPDDGRKRVYFAKGDFHSIHWTPYAEERAEAMRRFEAMKAMTTLRSEELAGAIDAYFEDESKLEAAPF